MQTMPGFRIRHADKPRLDEPHLKRPKKMLQDISDLKPVGPFYSFTFRVQQLPRICILGYQGILEAGLRGSSPYVEPCRHIHMWTLKSQIMRMFR